MKYFHSKNVMFKLRCNAQKHQMSLKQLKKNGVCFLKKWFMMTQMWQMAITK